MKTSHLLRDALIQEFHRRVGEESIPRIKKCLGLLNEEEVWHQPNENLNSAGNLILHLCGNARQWIVSGLKGKPDLRDRDAEFIQKGHKNKKELSDMLDQLMEEVRPVLEAMETEELLRVRAVQAFEESGLSIIIHVIEHFSYHTGQITYLTKFLKNVDTAYYGNVNLNEKGQKK